MQIRINKKTQELILIHSEARKEYIVSIYLEKPIYNSLSKVFKDISSKSANIVVLPEMGSIFLDAKLTQEFVHFNGDLLRSNKVGVFTQGNFSVDEVEVRTFGINNEYILVKAGKLIVAVISQYIQEDKFTMEALPDEFQRANIVIAPEKFAPKLLTGDFPVYIFYGNPEDFQKTTGISNFEIKEKLNIKKVETSILDTRTIYFLK